MLIEEVSPERFAELFYRYHQSLAQESGSARPSMCQAWGKMPGEEKWQIIAAARLALEELAVGDRERNKRYFAEPGKAEWGC